MRPGVEAGITTRLPRWRVGRHLDLGSGTLRVPGADAGCHAQGASLPRRAMWLHRCAPALPQLWGTWDTTDGTDPVPKLNGQRAGLAPRQHLAWLTTPALLLKMLCTRLPGNHLQLGPGPVLVPGVGRSPCPSAELQV